MIKKHRIRISIFILIYIQSFRRIEYTFVKYNSYKTLILANDLSIKCDLDPGCRRASKAMAYGWASYTSQFPTLIVNNIDMLNLFKSRILQSFLNFLIGAVVDVLWCIYYHSFLWWPWWRIYFISLEIHLVKILKIFSIVSNISMILFQKPLS